MEVHGIAGTLRYTGEPAEKVQGSKVVHGLRGYYDGVDAIVSFHPFYMLPLCNTARWDTQCGSYYSKVYSFVCDEPETWQLSANPNSPIPASHSAARAPGANVALMQMYTSSRVMQDAMLPSFGGWSLSDAILGSGQATADNLPARIAQIQYSWRCPTLEMAEHVLAVLDRNAEHAAAMAHCRVETTWVARNRPGITNHALAQALYNNLEEVGAPPYNDDAVAAARSIQSGLGIEPMEKPFLDECESLISPQDAEQALREHLAPWQKNWTSDDYVEMTHYAPTVRFYISRPALKPAPGKGAYPGWVMNALGGIPAADRPDHRGGRQDHRRHLRGHAHLAGTVGLGRGGVQAAQGRGPHRSPAARRLHAAHRPRLARLRPGRRHRLRCRSGRKDLAPAGAVGSEREGCRPTMGTAPFLP